MGYVQKLVICCVQFHPTAMEAFTLPASRRRRISSPLITSG